MQTSAGTPVANVVGFFLPIGHSMHLNSHTKGIQRIEEVPFFFFVFMWMAWLVFYLLWRFILACV